MSRIRMRLLCQTTTDLLVRLPGPLLAGKATVRSRSTARTLHGSTEILATGVARHYFQLDHTIAHGFFPTKVMLSLVEKRRSSPGRQSAKCLFTTFRMTEENRSQESTPHLARNGRWTDEGIPGRHSEQPKEPPRRPRERAERERSEHKNKDEQRPWSSTRDHETRSRSTDEANESPRGDSCDAEWQRSTLC